MLGKEARKAKSMAVVLCRWKLGGGKKKYRDFIGAVNRFRS